MQPSSRRYRPRTSADGEAGAATLESAGMWAVAALLVGAVALVIIAGAPGLGDVVRKAICIVVTLGQGQCGSTTTNAAQHVPVNPCVLQAYGHDSNVEVAVAVTVGVGDQWLVERLSDGRFKVTRGTSSKLGADVGVGLTAEVVVDDRPYGGSLAADAGVALAFKGGEVYYANDPAGVRRLLQQHGADVVKDVSVGGGGPVRWSVDQLENLLGAEENQLPEPTETYVEGGLNTSAGARATVVTGGAAAEAGTSQVLGVRFGRDGSTTEYISTTVSGKVGAGMWSETSDGGIQYSQAKAEGLVQLVTEIERNREGEVTTVRTRLVLAGEAAATNTQGNDVSGPSSDSYVERTAELPIRTEADRELAMSYLRSLGIQQVAGMSVQIPVTHLAGDGPEGVIRFVAATLDRGRVTEQSFNNETSSYGAALGGKLIGEIGGGGEVNTFKRNSTGARYFDGISWQPWRACG